MEDRACAGRASFPSRCDSAHGLELFEIPFNLLLPDIGDRPAADRTLRGGGYKLQILVKFCEFDALVRLQRHERGFPRLQRPRRQSAQTAAIVSQATESELRN